MGGSVNKVILIGRLGRDPESRSVGNGKVVNFSLATEETWRDKASGERKSKTEWHNVVIWNENLGKIAEQYLSKGSQVYIEGQLQSRKWQDKDGNERTTTEVVLQAFNGTLTLLGDAKGGGKGGDDDGDRGSRRGGGDDYQRGRDEGRSRDQGARSSRSSSRSAPPDDDIPF